jgi:hypothetical protein
VDYVKEVQKMLASEPYDALYKLQELLQGDESPEGIELQCLIKRELIIRELIFKGWDMRKFI